MMKSQAHRPLLAVSLGDPVGIGPEVVAKALSVREVQDAADFVVYGDASTLRRAVALAHVDARVEVVDGPLGALRGRGGGQGAPVIAVVPVSSLEVEWSVPTPGSDAAQLAYIERGVRAILDRTVDGIVTAPISKASISRAGSPYPGHTEMLAGLLEAEDGVVRQPVMMLAGAHLKVVPLTTHIALAEVPRVLTAERILHGIRVTHRTLMTYFGRPRPRIAVAGLNPHAGESGMFGTEESTIITPAIEAARADGVSVTGPLPADTVFRRAVDGEFDVVIGMYHDQALIPLKLLDFDRAVNVTLGLPIVRTSVDHGTAYDLAGKGVASAGSMIAAMLLAASMVRERRRTEEPPRRPSDSRA